VTTKTILDKGGKD